MTENKKQSARFVLQGRHCIEACFCLLLLLCPLAKAAAVLKGTGGIDLMESGNLYLDKGESFPEYPDQTWLSKLRQVHRVNLFGGSYWLYGEVWNDSGIAKWVLEPSNRLIEHAEVRIYLPNGEKEGFVSGYRAEHDYLLHNGKGFFLPPGSIAKVLVKLSSPYYPSKPKVGIYSAQDYRGIVLEEDTLILAAFGALLTLALYNLFIYWITVDRARLYYAVYMVTYFVGWAFTFQLPAELFGWHDLRLHYIPFFLLPVLNTLFYMEFLKLRQLFPHLAALSRINLVLPLALMPSCFLSLSHAHMLATLVISIWVTIALGCGILSLKSGFRPARYFVLAFIALLTPAAIILPANLGLIPEPVRDSELLTLLGGTLDGIFLAFALADKIRVLASEKDQVLEHLSKMLALTRTDHLTGISNRHAFDQTFDLAFSALRYAEDKVLVLIDLDGLKRVNDSYGHQRGDRLLCTFARALGTLESEGVSAFRLGGDEFTLLADRHKESEIVAFLGDLEKELWATGFLETGISYGVAYTSESGSPEDMLARADRRMYENKVSKRHARAQDILAAAP